MLNKNPIFTLVAVLLVTCGGSAFGAETPNPAKDTPGQRIAPDGSEVDKTKGGPIAIPFGGTAEKVETALTGTVMAVTKKSIRVKDAKGQILDFKITDKTATSDPKGWSGIIIKKDDNISALYDEKTMVMLKIQIIQ